jgi:hypothetical protein
MKSREREPNQNLMSDDFFNLDRNDENYRHEKTSEKRPFSGQSFLQQENDDFFGHLEEDDTVNKMTKPKRLVVL